MTSDPTNEPARGARQPSPPRSVVIAPSILAADFARLAEAAASVEGAADWLHVDVMDNHFVPNLTLGPPVVEALLKATSIPLDCHLMIDDPDRWAGPYAEAGAAGVTFHVEASADPIRLARALRARGARVGAALKPGTPLGPYEHLLPELDLLLLMTVEPGFGGQEFRTDVLPKLRVARRLADAGGLDLWLEVDGGINADTIAAAAEAGATAFVAGSAVYGADDPAVAIEALRALAVGATVQR